MFRPGFRERPLGFRTLGPTITVAKQTPVSSVTRPPVLSGGVTDDDDDVSVNDSSDVFASGGGCPHQPWRAYAPEGTVWGEECAVCDSGVSELSDEKKRPRPGDRLRAIARRL